MAIHVVPITEEDLHKEASDCDCAPKLLIDPESGEMVWAHQLVAPERLLEGFFPS